MPFPPVGRALRSPDGLLAAGGNLSVPRLLDAYRNGIFPWFNPGEPILWWSPDPRMVLVPCELKISRSFARVLRNTAYEVRCDTAFEQVMRGCAAPRGSRPAALPAPEGSASPCQGGHTWIHEDMIAAYCALHEMGHAHSVEVWMPKKSFQLQIEGETRRRRANEGEREVANTVSPMSWIWNWRAACMVSVSAACSTANPCSAKSAMRQKLRWRIWPGSSNAGNSA